MSLFGNLYVGAGGPVQNYQWEFQWANEDQWRTWGTGNGFETSAVNARWQGLKYRCIISDGAGKSLTSEIGTITLGALNITEQPQDQTIQDGKPVTLSMGAEGEDAAMIIIRLAGVKVGIDNRYDIAPRMEGWLASGAPDFTAASAWGNQPLFVT